MFIFIKSPASRALLQHVLRLFGITIHFVIQYVTALTNTSRDLHKLLSFRTVAVHMAADVGVTDAITASVVMVTRVSIAWE